MVKSSDYLLLSADFTINNTIHEEKLTAVYDFKDEYEEEVALNIILHQRTKESPAQLWFKGLFLTLSQNK